jgi:hypothetical protein
MKDRVCPLVGCFQSAIRISLGPELLTQPDTVFVAELWIFESAHRASLEIESVRNSIDRAMRLLSMSSQAFEVVRSPLLD